jgi:predicted  nucleic acid-binding Zn-ribbon protein
MTTDISTQAVEAMAKELEKCIVDYGCGEDEPWNAAKILRALAAERDALVNNVNELTQECSDLDSEIEEAHKRADASDSDYINVKIELASARRTALEDAAKVADHHINGAAVAKNIRALIEEVQP